MEVDAQSPGGDVFDAREVDFIFGASTTIHKIEEEGNKAEKTEPAR